MSSFDLSVRNVCFLHECHRRDPHTLETTTNQKAGVFQHAASKTKILKNIHIEGITLFPITATSCPERGDGGRPPVCSLTHRPIVLVLHFLCFPAHSVHTIVEHLPPMLLPIGFTLPQAPARPSRSAAEKKKARYVWGLDSRTGNGRELIENK